MKLTINFFITLCLGLSININAASIVEKVVGQLGKGTAAACARANIWNRKITIRSGNGIACKNPTVAAIAELVCGMSNIEEYDKSGCHKNAMTALDGKEPKEVLLNQGKSMGGKLIGALCAKNIDVLQGICSSLAPAPMP